MGKKKKEKKKEQKKAKALQEKALQKLETRSSKSKCCEKYQKGEHKRCGRCPCFDLLKMKKVA